MKYARETTISPPSGRLGTTTAPAAAVTESRATITESGGYITFLRQDNASPPNALRHVAYSHSGNVWTRTDLLTGASESLVSTDDPPDNEQDAWEKSEWLTFKVAGRILSGSLKTRTLVGKGEAAAWRETTRSEWDGQVSDWRYTSMSYWQDNLNLLVNGLPMLRTSEDGSWEYRQYDERGRELLRREPLDGFGYWSNVCVATATAYEPPPVTLPTGETAGSPASSPVTPYVVASPTSSPAHGTSSPVARTTAGRSEPAPLSAPPLPAPFSPNPPTHAPSRSPSSTTTLTSPS